MKGTVRFVEHDGRRVWCGVVGDDPGRPPLVCIPGGPGAPHDYLETLSPLAGRGRQVIYYDAMGSGRSDRPAGTAWTQETYVAELAAVVRGLGLGRYHLFAHSAAVLAALPHALERPAGLASLILGGTPVNMPEHTAHLEAILIGMGVPREELAGFEDEALQARNANYARIYHTFMGRYMTRVRPIPAILIEMPKKNNTEAYLAMKGGRILYTTPLRAWDMSGRLGEVAVPVLVTIGRHDMMPVSACEKIRDALPRAELAVFENSGHMPHLDEAAAYVARLDDFMRRCDQSPDNVPG